MLLRLKLSSPDRIELELDSPNQPLRTAAGPYSFQLTDAQQEDLRWYLEDYLVYPTDPTFTR
jgi:hypothetical protein